MKKILILCSAPRDIRELSNIRFTDRYSFIFNNFTNEPLYKLIYGRGYDEGRTIDAYAILQEALMRYRNSGIDGIINSVDYPGSALSALVARELKLPTPDPAVVLLCQHKYYARRAQEYHVPEAVPQSVLVTAETLATRPFPLPFPLFVKPVKASFSYGAQVVHSDDELKQLAENFVVPDSFLQPFNQMFKLFYPDAYPANHLLAEELLHGQQVTLEGYVFNGAAQTIGITDSLMFDNGISFRGFEYPSALPIEIQDRMSDIAHRCMRGIGFDNGLFNIEFFYHKEANRIHIIEINPRMCNQFADLYEKVDGLYSYDIAISIATGVKPVMVRGEGKHARAAICVLRTFNDALVVKNPNPKNIEILRAAFPDMRLEIFSTVGQYLSQDLQDGKSYRYATIHLGGSTAEDLEEKFEYCKRLLDFEFA